MSIMICTNCERHVDTDFHYMSGGENPVCEPCEEELFDRGKAYWEPLYRGEHLAGLLPPNHYDFNR